MLVLHKLRYMYQKKPGIDIIAKVLDAVYRHNTDALFTMSLMHQYEERGSLSKKQLQGLLLKAQKVKDLPPNWLGTLEAIILKMPTRDKTPVLERTPIYQKDPETGRQIMAILHKYPEHKRVLFFRAKYEHHEMMTPEELAELQKFYKLLAAQK